MIIGQTLMGSSSSYYTPWFPRQGDASNFSAQIIAGSGATLTVVVETKNSSEVDGSATAIANGTFSGTTGIITNGTLVVGLKELVRFKCNASTGSGAFVHFRFLPPTWEAN